MKTAIFFDHESTHCRVCDALFGKGACQERRGQHDVLVNLPGIVKYVGKHYGPVALAKAYADWTYFKNYVPDLNRSLVELVHVPYVSGTKNAADMRLLLDAYADTANAPDISTVVIVSCDRDFSNLAVRLRRLGKTVVGVGVEGAKISSEWIQACDRFHHYPILKRDSDPPEESDQVAGSSPVPPTPSATESVFAKPTPQPEEVAAAGAKTNDEDDEEEDDQTDDTPVHVVPVPRMPVPYPEPHPFSLGGSPPRFGPPVKSRPPMPRPKTTPVPKPNGSVPRSTPMPGPIDRPPSLLSRRGGLPPQIHRPNTGPNSQPPAGDV